MRDPERARRNKIRRAVVIEIIIMAIETLCCLLPLPWRFLVPIIIGARTIILKAHDKMKEPPAEIHCCGGNMQEKKDKKRNGKEKAKKDVNVVGSRNTKESKAAAGKRGGT